MSPPMLPRWVAPAIEIVTVGLPFCAFKILTGMIATRSSWLEPLGYALLALGAVDLVLNAVNLVALVAMHRRVTAACVTDVVWRRARRSTADSELGLAVDVFLSFGLVALVIGFGLLLQLPAWALPIWNLAVVLNVLGAGIGRLFAALRHEQAA